MLILERVSLSAAARHHQGKGRLDDALAETFYSIWFAQDIQPPEDEAEFTIAWGFSLETVILKRVITRIECEIN